MKLNLSKLAVDIDLKTIEPKTSLGRVLANQLASSTTGDPLKFWDWAVVLAKERPEIELDAADWQVIQEFVKTSPGMNNLAKGQILRELNEQNKLP